MLGGKGVEAVHEDIEAELVDVSSPVDLSPDVDGGRRVEDRRDFSLTVSASGAVSASHITTLTGVLHLLIRIGIKHRS